LILQRYDTEQAKAEAEKVAMRTGDVLEEIPVLTPFYLFGLI